MKIALLGKDGQVGWELQRALSPLGELVAPELAELNLEDLDGTRRVLREIKPEVIVNAAAYTAVDRAELEPARARRVNAEAVAVLAEEARRLGAWLVHYSTDYVFDGMKSTAYLESDPTGPLSVYGATKLEGEQAIREQHTAHLIFRTSWVYGARGNNFLKTILRLAKERESLTVVADQHGAPTSAELLADVTALALYRIRTESSPAQHLSGTYHVTAAGETTWYDYARYVIGFASERGIMVKTSPERIESISSEAYKGGAARPKNSRLSTAKAREAFHLQLPHWRFHVARTLEELTAQGAI